MMKIYIQQENYAKAGAPVIIVKQKILGNWQYEITETRFSISGTRIDIRQQTTVSDKDVEHSCINYHYYCLASYEETVKEYEKIQLESIGIRLTIALVREERQFERIASAAIQFYSCINVLQQKDLIQSLAKQYGFTLDLPTTDKLDKTSRRDPASTSSFENPIKEILYNDEKKVVIVLFKDGTKIVEKCHENDDFDLEVGVALAITKHMYGNTTNYKKYLRRKAKKLNK